MKRIALFSMIALLTACSLFRTETSDTDIWKAKKNTECMDIKAVKVFQTLDEGALAFACDGWDTKYCSGMTVYVPQSHSITTELYDDKVIKTPENKCFILLSTYKYETKGGSVKTVPVVEFGYSYTPESSDEFRSRFYERAVNMYADCKDHFIFGDKKMSKSLKAEGEKFCMCLDDLATQLLESSPDTEQTDALDKDLVNVKFALDYATGLENCGKKYPNAAKAY